VFKLLERKNKKAKQKTNKQTKKKQQQKNSLLNLGWLTPYKQALTFTVLL